MDFYSFSEDGAKKVVRYIEQVERDNRFPPAQPGREAITPSPYVLTVQVTTVPSAGITPTGGLYNANFALYSGQSTAPTTGDFCFYFDINGNPPVANRYYPAIVQGAMVVTGAANILVCHGWDVQSVTGVVCSGGNMTVTTSG